MAENDNTSTNITVNNSVHCGLATCEQCQFMQSCKLSQQIVQLRQKLLFYESKNKQIHQFIALSQAHQADILNQYDNILSSQITSTNCSQIALTMLEKQLSQLQQQLSHQRQLQQEDKAYENELRREFNNEVQNRRYLCEREYNRVLKQLHRLEWKQTQLVQIQSLLERTNFIDIIYSISFEDAHSYLNGEKITPENSWKIVQILAFYQQKYPLYDPAVKINWNSMQILPNITQLKQSSYFDSILFNPIQISCDSASIVLNTWMQFIILQLKNLFEFIVRESGINAKLKYEITKDGQFEITINTAFKSYTERFNLIVKCLLIDIDQINKLQFFAKERRINQSINQSTNQPIKQVDQKQ